MDILDKAGVIVNVGENIIGLVSIGISHCDKCLGKWNQDEGNSKMIENIHSEKKITPSDSSWWIVGLITY